MDSKNLTISDPLPSLIEGLKICKISNGKGATMFASEDEVDTPYEPSSFEKTGSNKLNLDINCSKEYLNFFTQFDDWAVEYITLNSLRLLGVEHPIEKVKEIYKPCVKRDLSYEPKLKTKITLEGSGRTRYWPMDKRSRLAPDCWPTSVFKTQVRIAFMYVTEANIGFTLDCMDIQISKEFSPTTCPF